MHMLTFSKYSKFMKMDAKVDIKRGNPPPTDIAAINHSPRVYQQTITWETLATTSNPLHWRWIEENGKLTPKQTDKNVAPSDFLKFIKCNGKSFKNMCSINQCTCKRYLKCIPAYEKCRAEVHENHENVIDMIGY